MDEVIISKAIIESYKDKLVKALDVDVAIAGGGPAGVICAYYLAKQKKKVVLFERKLSLGGGMWGGGMLFNDIVVQDCAKKILEEVEKAGMEFEGTLTEWPEIKVGNEKIQEKINQYSK